MRLQDIKPGQVVKFSNIYIYYLNNSKMFIISEHTINNTHITVLPITDKLEEVSKEELLSVLQNLKSEDSEDPSDYLFLIDVLLNNNKISDLYNAQVLAKDYLNAIEKTKKWIIENYPHAYDLQNGELGTIPGIWYYNSKNGKREFKPLIEE